MAIAKRLQRQADTCAQLAAATYDDESRERYLRLEQLYRRMLVNDGESEVRFASALSSDLPEQRPV
ncbi:hypothetical protein [Undibacter mobilis]|uniref:Uncharacterized protein n=1 Tax=Undibacter mobilis TaxID=2292256 RepID=A0A371BB04_9BRAD|nr:hypothetical protein [Undibacter mobilis]RDV04583.1 hypothetical protein DXH78_08395 [Undibacter mobilis]